LKFFIQIFNHSFQRICLLSININFSSDKIKAKAELEVLTNQNRAYQEQALLQTQQLGEISQENKSLQESVNQHKDELTTLTNSFNLVTAEVDVYREKANSLETNKLVTIFFTLSLSIFPFFHHFLFF
jgi:uncharacterized protein YlxW (UPF0749 family)